MDWIKKNYDQAALLFVAVILMGMSVWLYLTAQSFGETFANISGQVVHNNKIQPLDTSLLDQASDALSKPGAWAPGEHGSLFVSEKYIVDKEGRLISPLTKGQLPIHPPVPNEWFAKYKVDFLADDALSEDPDLDGFSNLDEFNGGTNPQDKNSHPPYLSKLRVVKAIKVPFRLRFSAYDGDPTKLDSLTFQLNTIDIKQPTQFLKIGDPIAKTKFKVAKFEYKKAIDPKTDAEKDVSELTVENAETGDQVVLVLDSVVDSPDSYALFKFLWDGSQFAVKKDKTFALKPEPDITYKLVDISDREAHIENVKTGEKITVPKLEAP